MKKIKVRKIFSEAWNLYKPNWGMISLFGLMLAIVVSIQQILTQIFVPEGTLGIIMFIIMNIVSVIISLLISMGTYRFLLNLVDTKKPEVKDILRGAVSVKHVLKYFVITLLAGIFVMFGFIALIIPGIILALALAFVKFSAVENRHAIWEDIKYNWNLTNGYRMTIFRFSIYSLLVGLGGLFLFGVGILVAIPVILIANAMLYRELQSIKTKQWNASQQYQDFRNKKESQHKNKDLKDSKIS